MLAMFSSNECVIDCEKHQGARGSSDLYAEVLPQQVALHRLAGWCLSLVLVSGEMKFN